MSRKTNASAASDERPLEVFCQLYQELADPKRFSDLVRQALQNDDQGAPDGMHSYVDEAATEEAHAISGPHVQARLVSRLAIQT